MTTKEIKTFADLGLSEEILESVKKKGFEKPSPIQAGVIPLLLNGEKDIIGQAQTGTGKTAAFALPLLEKIDASEKKIQAIILAPTRELAIQVGKEIESFSVKNSPTVAVFYGGNYIKKEIDSLKTKPNIVVGTPGRIHHHIRNKNLSLNDIRYFVLDEADEMLNFGFREEIEEILELTPKDRKVLLFSATMPKSILHIAESHMGDYDMVKIKAEEMTNKNITQKYYAVRDGDKFDALGQIMEAEETFYSIVFCKTKIETDFVASKLINQHLKAKAIHGDIDQSKRERILKSFRNGEINILVATDVAARGIDIADLNFVVNYSLPENFEIYTHRIGRTGRAGNKGTAITFVNGSEIGKLRSFERNLKVTLKKGVLPTVEQIISKKKEHLINRVEHIIDTEKVKFTLPLAELLLEEAEPAKVVAALLQDAYNNDFNPNTYKTIVEDKERRSRTSDRGGSRGRWGGNRRGGNGGGNGGGNNRRRNFSSKRSEGRSWTKR